MAWKLYISCRTCWLSSYQQWQSVDFRWFHYTFNCERNGDTKELDDIHRSSNLRQNVKERTHIHCHTLVHVISSDVDRKYKTDDVLVDMHVSSLVLVPPEYVDHLVNLHNSKFCVILNEHEPSRKKEIINDAMLPWCHKIIQATNLYSRHGELLWIRTGCVLIMKCPRSVEVKLKVPFSLLYHKIIIKYQIFQAKSNFRLQCCE